MDAVYKTFVEYEKTINDPNLQCKKLFDFINEQCGISVEYEPKMQTIAESVQSNLRMNKSEVPFEDFEMATNGQKSLYAFLKKKVSKPDEKPNFDNYRLYEGWREYLYVLFKSAKQSNTKK